MRNIVTITISSLACVMGLNINMTAAYADSDPYIGDIVLTAATFCPNGWNEANGQTVAIAANQSLYSLIGTKFGGDGTTTFRLPDLRGRFAVGAGSAPGLTPRVVGQQFGSEGVTVPASALPSHTHSVSTASGDAANSPKNKFFVTRDAGINAYTQATLPGNALVHCSARDLSINQLKNSPL